MIVVAQIEHVEAVRNLDDILSVSGLTSIVVGPNDLAGSLGHIGEPRHPQVLEAIGAVIAIAGRKNVPVGLAVGEEPATLIEWVTRGVRWLAMGNDTSLLLRAATGVAQQVRGHLGLEH
jgi:2-dehydro-3-deoxyglucarate aldolase/4-hydroxy-2-oxoheptanedioate aldolase